MIQSLREWWQNSTGEEDTPFDGDTGAWLVSLVAHLCVLICMALALLAMPDGPVTLLVSTEPEKEVEEIIEPPIDEVYFSDEVSEEVGANSLAGTAMAEAAAPVLSEHSKIDIRQDFVADSTIHLQSDNVSTSPTVSNKALTKGALGVGATGASGAVDRITYEILQSLEQRRTLVVWLFDSSPSMKTQRDEINTRFEKIYEELGVLEKRGNKTFKKYDKSSKPLLTSILSYGGTPQVAFNTKEPTDSYEDISEAVKGIKDDESGVEMTFTAIKAAGERHLKWRQEGRNVMLVVVTDEAADDSGAIEDTLNVVRRYEMPVYVIGVPAPFGREEAPVKFQNTDPMYEQATNWIPVRQGPESVGAEVVKLAFWGQEKSKDGVDPDLLDSGFGPFHLTRLCYETGGIYFSVHAGKSDEARLSGRAGAKYTANLQARLDKFFDPTIMRAYAPDYVTNQEYQQLLNSNKARMALNRAAGMTWTGAMENPRTNFPYEGPGEFKTMLDEAQKTSAVLEPRLNQLYETLKIGEADRAKITQPRWQAGYDLAMGRTLASKVRTEGYNLMLAELKRGKKFENEKNDTWELVNSDKIETGSVMTKLADQAKMYLERVVKEHEGTPWHYLAKKELETPLGWEIKESYTGVQAKKEAAADAAAAAAANPADAVKKLMKPKAPVPKRI
jgi:hypothetical protein